MSLGDMCNGDKYNTEEKKECWALGEVITLLEIG